MHSLEELLKKLPEADREKIFEQLYDAIQWRGWDVKSDCHAADAIRSINDIFAKNHIEFSEYC